MNQTSPPEMLESLVSADLPVGDVCSRNLLECPPELPLCEAARRMREGHCSSILICEEGRLQGIWTEHDALAVDFSNPEAFNRPIGEVMSTPVKAVAADTSMHEVAMRFHNEGVRHFVVLEGGRPLGIVSQTDAVLNQGIEHYLRLRTVSSALREELLLLDADTPLSSVAAHMRRLHADATVVRYAEGDYGIITERDMVRLIAEGCGDIAIGGLASRPLRTIAEETSLFSARNLLIGGGIRHLGVLDADGALSGLISFTDILSGMEFVYVQELKSALNERDRALKLSRRSLHLAEKVIESSLEGVMITNAEGLIESVNPAFSRLTGYDAEEVIGHSPSILSSGRHDAAFYESMWGALREHGQWQGEIWNRRKSGETYPELLTITAITDERGELTHYASLFSDITDLKENEERIRHLAYYDPLTELPNRRLFNDRLSLAIAHGHRSGTALAVMFIDLDRFKRINDSLGHGVGDALLLEVSRRLRAAVREDDTVARMGGDEFIVLLPELDGVEDARQSARRILQVLAEPLEIEGHELVISCSIGISLYPNDGDDIDTLVQNADTAMYRAKSAGRNGFSVYSAEMGDGERRSLDLEGRMRRALERGEFELFYQPIVEAAEGRVVAAETLLRWRDPEQGLISPAEFIPLAEESGLIMPIGEWVLEQVCRDRARIDAAGGGHIELAVNISALQFRSKAFLRRARQLLAPLSGREGGLGLGFELTESVLMEDELEAMRRLSAIRELGVAIALDDFGTGYSSLSYLKRFPIDKLKIDRAFIIDMCDNPTDQALVGGIVNLSHSLNLPVVAEGVESESQWHLLREQGCDLIQGFHFARPQPLGEWLAAM